MPEPTTANIRQYLTAAYNDDDLTALCADYFRDVADTFAAGMTKTQKIQLLLDHCQRRDLLPNLLAALHNDRPAQYQRQFGSAALEPAPAPAPRARDPRQVFISHAHEDADFAHRLATDLQTHGWRTWIAPESISPGEKWGEAISRGLEECGVFVVVLTPAAVRSRWVTTETTLAIELEHKDLLRFIPVEVATCHPPLLWTAYQCIPFTPRYASGLAALLATLDRRPPPIAAVQPPSVLTPSAQPAHPQPAEMTQPQPVTLKAEVKPAATPAPSSDTHMSTESRPEKLFEPAATPAPSPDAFIITAPIRLELLRVPAGEFLMGSDPTQDPQAAKEEQPQHRIHLPEFYIGRYPVTNEQYVAFVKATQRQAPEYWTNSQIPANKSHHPVVNVTWHEAVTFCAWLSQTAGQPIRLPTEAEWEKAARGPDGRPYPWGNQAPDTTLCNFGENVSGTTPVGSYPAGASPYGLLDVAGNVWEWCSDFYVDQTYRLRAAGETRNPTGPASGTHRVLRGGSYDSDATYVRCAYRYRSLPVGRYVTLGFRVARSSR